MGKGAYGDVYEAFCKNLGLNVALKVLRGEPQYIKAGQREAEVSKKLMKLKETQDFGSVEFYDYFYYKEHLILVFEKLEISILDFLEGTEYCGLSIKDIAYIGKQILQTLKVVHKEGLIHGDLKPENILFLELNPN